MTLGKPRQDRIHVRRDREKFARTRGWLRHAGRLQEYRRDIEVQEVEACVIVYS
jgi:hypothetical protein